MKYLFTYLTFIILLGSCVPAKEIYLSTSFREPANEGLRYIFSHDGYNWDTIPGVWLKPEVGTQQVMRDPSITRGPDGTFHMVWTTSWKDDKGFGYASSKDLMHWTTPRHIPVMAYDTSTVNVWAPEFFYEDENAEYIIVWASTVPYKFPKGLEEELNNHRLYYVKTKDFVTFTRPEIFFDPGFSVIDAVVIKRKSGDYINVFKDNTRPERNIRVAFGKTATGPWNDISPAFTGNFTEGPTVIKKENDYLIYYDAYREMKFGAAKTTDFINFTDISDSISIPVGHKHGTMIKVPLDIVKNLLKQRK
jgi:hypothetical protein